MTNNPDSTPEKLLVCIGPGPSSEGLIRSAKNLAERLHAKWIAVHVENPAMLMTREAGRDRVADNLRLAEHLGAETVILSGRSVADEILRFAGERKVSRIIAGKPGRTPWTSIVLGSPVDRLVRLSGSIDVQIMAGERGNSREAVYAAKPGSAELSDYGTGFLFLIMATVLCFMMYPYLQLSNLIMIYLLAVMLTATGCGRRPAVLVSLLSVLSFDFFFVPPRFTLTVEDAQYIVTFAVMFLVALVISHLASMMRRQTEIARLHERQSAAMQGLSRQLAGARGTEEILRAAVRYIREIMDCSVVAMLPDEKGKLHVASGDASSVLQKDILNEIDIAHSAYDTGRNTGWGTGVFSTADILCVPLQAGDTCSGVLVLKPEDPHRFLLPEQVRLLESLAKQVALALEVERLAASFKTLSRADTGNWKGLS